MDCSLAACGTVRNRRSCASGADVDRAGKATGAVTKEAAAAAIVTATRWLGRLSMGRLSMPQSRVRVTIFQAVMLFGGVATVVRRRPCGCVVLVVRVVTTTMSAIAIISCVFVRDPESETRGMANVWLGLLLAGK